MKPILVLLLAASLFVSGCDALNQQHFRVAGVAKGSPDAAKVKSILQIVADKTDLADRTTNSDVPDTLVFYESAHPTNLNPNFVLGARFYDGNIFIDIDGRFGPNIPKLNHAQHLLARQLSEEFGSRFSIVETYPSIDIGLGFLSLKRIPTSP